MLPLLLLLLLVHVFLVIHTSAVTLSTCQIHVVMSEPISAAPVRLILDTQSSINLSSKKVALLKSVLCEQFSFNIREHTFMEYMKKRFIGKLINLSKKIKFAQNWDQIDLDVH